MPSVKVRSLTVFFRKEIQELFARARRQLQHQFLEIRSAPRTREYGRILIVIPRAVGSAVQRNLLRRRIKSLFYEKKWYTGPYDYILLTRPGAAQLSFAELEAILSTVCTGAS